jgi:hypothetical protein
MDYLLCKKDGPGLRRESGEFLPQNADGHEYHIIDVHDFIIAAGHSMCIFPYTFKKTGNQFILMKFASSDGVSVILYCSSIGMHE